MKTKELEQAADYVRMSSDKQEASPARQRSELTKLAAAHGCTIERWYEDLAKTGTEAKKRGGFQELLRDCEKRKWRTVFYYEPSRLSREHPLDSLAHLNVFRKTGVRLISTTRDVVDSNDIGGLIMSMVDAHGSHDESVKLAARSVSGRRLKYENGERACGMPLFGFEQGGPIELDNSDLAMPSQCTWMNVVEYVSRQQRPVRFSEVWENCGVSSCVTAHRLGKAVAGGRLRYLGRSEGYITAEKPALITS